MKKIIILLVGVIGSLVLFAACGDSKTPEPAPAGADTEPPVITVEGVPETCTVGARITLPAASAYDAADGDLSGRVTLTFSLLRADGEAVSRHLLENVPADRENTAEITSVFLLEYKLVYTCADNAGNTAEKIFYITAGPDEEGGTLTLNEDSVPDFDLAAGICGVGGENVILPAAKAIDLPSGKDISERVSVQITEDGFKEPLLSVRGAAEPISVRLPCGSYSAVYSVKDASGNLFAQSYSFPVKVELGGAANLIGDAENFAVSGAEGFSRFNEYGEICFGNTSATAATEETIGFAEKYSKIHEQYVGIVFNADSPGMAGQMFYSLSARGNRDSGTLPSADTGSWPDYLFLRIEPKQIVARVERTSDAPMETVREFKGELLDGKDHSLYVQWKNYGASADAEDAAIYIYGWVDKTPVGGYDRASFIFKAAAGDSTGKGTLQREVFRQLWDETTGAGWFCMDTLEQTTPYSDDYMRIKGMAVYSKEERGFKADIKPPVLTSSFAEGIYALGEEIDLGACRSNGGENVTVYVIFPDGEKREVLQGRFTPEVAGIFTAVYEAADEAGNIGYLKREFSVGRRDDVAPVLELTSETALSVAFGKEFKLPGASASDNLDGDLTDFVTVEITGSLHKTGLKPGASVSLLAAGEYVAVFSVTDSFGNRAEKTITISVTGSTQGNLLQEHVVLDGKSMSLVSQQYVYGQKVSMKINISRLDSIVMFNLRGAVYSSDWPKGIVLRFIQDGSLSISAKGHDEDIYASADVDMASYLGRDIIFDYQTENVNIGGEEYLRTRVWIDGEELSFFAVETGKTGLENGINGVYRLLSDFNGDQSENIYASPVTISTYEAAITVKEIRIDGISCVLAD